MNPMRLGLALILLTSAMACVSLKKNAPEKRYYVLDAHRTADTSAVEKSPVTILVRRLAISPRCEGQEFVYRTGDLTFESDFYHQFFIPPAAIISEETEQWLTSSGAFEEVIGEADRSTPDCVLEGSIAALHGDYTATPAKAVLEIQFMLRVANESQRILFQKDYRQEQPATGDDPAALARGWNQALATILNELSRDLADSLKAVAVSEPEP